MHMSGPTDIVVMITNAVCFLIFPQSATTHLRGSISKSLDSFSTLLTLLTSTFLLSNQTLKPSQASLEEAIKAHASAFKILKTDLGEAKHERIFDPRIRGRKLDLYDAVIGSLTRLAQHLGSLRGSIRLQEDLIKAWKEGKIDLDLSGKNMETRKVTEYEDEEMTGSVKLFQDFREISGTPMEGLVVRAHCFWRAYTTTNPFKQDKCDEGLNSIQAIIRDNSSETTNLVDIRTDLNTALRDFTQSSSRAIKRLYAGPRREQGIYDTSLSEESGEEDEKSTDSGSHMEGPNETVFLLYL